MVAAMEKAGAPVAKHDCGMLAAVVELHIGIAQDPLMVIFVWECTLDLACAQAYLCA